jgi:hypothetical protein
MTNKKDENRRGEGMASPRLSSGVPVQARAYLLNQSMVRWKARSAAALL